MSNRLVLAFVLGASLLFATSCASSPPRAAQPPPTTPAQKLTACVANLQTIDTALRMYAGDSAGRFPTTLSVLTPKYLKSLPTCPAAGKDTYSGTYMATGATPDAYSDACGGNNHADAGMAADQPQISSARGLQPAGAGGVAPPSGISSAAPK